MYENTICIGKVVNAYGIPARKMSSEESAIVVDWKDVGNAGETGSKQGDRM
jgi:hypothetical protein